jgi:hypothetical protein
MKGSSRNTAAEGGIVALYYGGTIIGALMAGYLADRCGRIKSIVFGCLWATFGAVLQASAYNITWMCFGRVICESFDSDCYNYREESNNQIPAGVGVGSIDCVIPVWSAEVSNHSARGAFLALEFVMVRLLSTILHQSYRFCSKHSLEYRWFGIGLLDRILCLFESERGHGLAHTTRPLADFRLCCRSWHQLFSRVTSLANEDWAL